MKKLAIACAVLAVIFGIVSYNIWRAYQDPLTATPSPLDLGRQHLHQQLLDSEKREAEIEQADWNSITLLEPLIKVHQARIDKLTGNIEAGEILAHDKDAIARIQKRIADLQQQQRALPPAETQPNAETSATSPAAPAATAPLATTQSGAPKPAHPDRQSGPTTSPHPPGTNQQQPAQKPPATPTPQR